MVHTAVTNVKIGWILVVLINGLTSFSSFAVANLPNSNTDIISFSFTEQTEEVTPNSTTHTITLEVDYGTDVSSLTPTIILSANGTISPASGIVQDFISPLDYTVTAEDGSTTEVWTITVTTAQNTETDITSFSFTGQNEPAIPNTTTHNVQIDVPYGTDVSAIAPDIELSAGASIDPASGVNRNFTHPKVYTVTAEDGVTEQLWVVTVNVRDVIESDYLALVSLYNSTEGPNWLNNDNWLSYPVDSWHGVTISEGRVTELWLTDNSLNGIIPTELGNLTQLKSLVFSNNNLSGTIPSELGNLVELTGLYLFINNLSGSIPQQLGNLSKLESLVLAENSLTGSLPEELGDLSNLSHMNLANNDLTGNIPSNLGNLESINILHLNDNSFDGIIPPEFGDLSTVQILTLGGNSLTGSIPPELGNLADLTTLTLDNNSLTGSLPPELGSLSKLTVLTLSSNSLSGSIPSVIGNLTSLTFLGLDYNNFDGSVPTEFQNLVNMAILGISGNKLDEFPNLSSFPNWVQLNMRYNNFEFDDILPNIEIEGVLYSPQSNIPAPESIDLVSGDQLNLTISIGGEGNEYQWIKDNTHLIGQTTNNLLIESISQEDAGVYYLESTNPSASRLNLRSDNIIVNVGPNPETDIETFEFVEQTNIATINTTTHNVDIEVSYKTNLASLTPIISLSTGATISPNSATTQDFTNPFIYTVSAEDGINSQSWTINVTETLPSIETDIEDFSFVEQTGIATINSTTHTLDIEVAYGADVTSLTPTVTLPAGATAFPNPTVSQDFSSPVIYTITAEDETTSQHWTITVSKALPNIETDIEDFSFVEQIGTATVDPSSHTIDIDVAYGTNVASLTPTITLSSGATTSPNAATVQDFTTPVTYTITSEDEVNSQEWIVTAHVRTVVLSDSLALVALYNATNGHNWQYKSERSNWLFGSANTWTGVSITNGRVSALELPSNNIDGSLPPEFGNLTNLISLKLPGNDISGSLPAEIGNLESLEYLDLYNNDLTGSIPSEIGKLTNLTYLMLSENLLSGSIPPEIGDLNSLKELFFTSNSLTGSIPPELGDLSSLETLSLEYNSLTGSIPPELGNLSNLDALRLTNNALNGSIPPEIGNLASLTSLSFYENELSGSIPPELGNLTNIKVLQISSNLLSGNIPSEIGSLINLKELYLFNNELDGEIPKEIGNLVNLEWLLLRDNFLSGSIPSEMGNLPKLLGLHLQNNELTGSIPNSFSNLQTIGIFLQNNNLDALPDISSLSSLGAFNVSNNHFTFEDLEPNVSLITDNTGQKPFGESQNYELSAEENQVLSFTVGGDNNIYQWNKDGEVIPGATEGIYNILSANTSDAGIYTLDVSNSVVTGLTISSVPINVTVEPNTRANVVSFGFAEQSALAQINEIEHTVNIEVGYDSNLASLIASFALSSGATAKVAEVLQISGATINNYITPIAYSITSEDGNVTEIWTITVILALNTETDVTAFTFTEQASEVNPNTITHTVDIEVAYGTDISSLTPTIALSDNATIEPIIGVAQDFTSPVAYTVTAEDGSTTEVWIVTVTTAQNIEADITAFNFTEQTSEITPNTTTHTIDIEVAYGTDVSSLTPTITTSQSATIEPASEVAGDFTSHTGYTVTAEDGVTTHDWIVTVTIAPNIETDITAFSFTEQTSEVTPNPTTHTIDVEVAYGSDVSSLAPTITLSDNATISPASGVAQDFTSPMDYTVTAEDGTTEVWTVTVTTAPNIEADITAFSFTEQTSAVTPNTTTHTIDIEIAYGTDVSSLTPTITLSENATIEPIREVAQDFTNSVIYTVTAEDGITIQNWTVTVTIAPNIETDITVFSFTEQTDVVTPNSATHTIDIEVAYGTVISALIPNFELSGGATALVGSTSQVSETTSNDFTGLLIYTITAEDGMTSQDWTVTVTIAPNTETDITALSFTEQTGAVTPDPTAHAIDIKVPFGTDVTALVSMFELSPGATAKVSTSVQETGVTSNDFTSPITYIITAEDGSTAQDWVVTVTIAPNVETDILSFSLTEQIEAATIDVPNHTIDLEVERDTDITSLIPTITLSSGGTISPNNGVAQDFTNSVVYNVTAEDGTTTQDWVVTVIEEAILGLLENLENKLIIYPNPAAEELVIDYSEISNKPMTISVTNLSGKLMETMKVNTGRELRMDVKNYPSGIYMLHLHNDKMNIYSKFIRK